MSGIISDNVGRATGLIKAAGGGGKILQVIDVSWKTATSSTACCGTFAAITDAEAIITPSATSSKIWINAMINVSMNNYAPYIKIQLDGSDIADALGTVTGNRIAMTGMVPKPGDSNELSSTYISFVDSPSSTSELTYTFEASSRHTGGWSVNYPHADTDFAYVGHAISTITLMEIDGS